MSRRMMVGEATAGWVAEEQTRRTKEEMKKQAGAKAIEKATDEASARGG